MSTTDPVADYLTRVRNAVKARHKRVDIPASTLKRAISRVLVEQGYVAGVSDVGSGPQAMLRIQLRYSDGQPAISGLKRISKPGRRVYLSAPDVPRVMSGLGVAIISTSKGLLTDRQAREQKIGGEVLCHVW